MSDQEIDAATFDELAQVVIWECGGYMDVKGFSAAGNDWHASGRANRHLRNGDGKYYECYATTPSEALKKLAKAIYAEKPKQ